MVHHQSLNLKSTTKSISSYAFICIFIHMLTFSYDIMFYVMLWKKSVVLKVNLISNCVFSALELFSRFDWGVILKCNPICTETVTASAGKEHIQI